MALDSTDIALNTGCFVEERPAGRKFHPGNAVVECQPQAALPVRIDRLHLIIADAAGFVQYFQNVAAAVDPHCPSALGAQQVGSITQLHPAGEFVIFQKIVYCRRKRADAAAII